RVVDDAALPQEHARIPEAGAGLVQLARPAVLGLRLKAVDRVDAQLPDPYAIVVGRLDVAELRVRTGRANTEGHEGSFDAGCPADHVDSHRGHRFAERVVLVDLVIGA